MLVLPVKTRALVFWPMLFGSLMAVCLWAVTVKVVYRSSGLAIPLGMPALALVVDRVMVSGTRVDTAGSTNDVAP